MSIWSKIKEVTKKAIETTERIDSQYEMLCLGVETRLTGGSSFDEKMEEPILPAVKKSMSDCVAATKKHADAAISTAKKTINNMKKGKDDE